MRPAAAAMLLALGLNGCIQARNWELGPPLSQADAVQPAPGVGLAQVLAKLGPPLRLSATPNGFVMAWEHWVIRERKLGFSLGLAGADFLSVDWGRAVTSGDFLLMRFDGEHRLLTSHLLEWDSAASGGQGLQPFASVVDVVDVADLLRPLPAHAWGFGSLEPLPVALNRQHRMGTGHGGLEQRGTSGALGQHALEWR